MFSNIVLSAVDYSYGFSFTDLIPAQYLALAGALLIVFLVVMLALYIYYALVWQTIARKLGYSKPWVAWIPIVNIILFPILAKKHWAWVFILLVPFANIVFMFIWMWKIFERRNYPGWLSLLPLLSIIPILNILVGIGYLVLMGLVAWKDR